MQRDPLGAHGCDPTVTRCGTCHLWDIYNDTGINECWQYEEVVEEHVFNEVVWNAYCSKEKGFKCDVVCPGDWPPRDSRLTTPHPSIFDVGTRTGRLSKLRDDLQRHCEEMG